MEIQRESMDVDVLIVGGGPSGLATAIHLMKLIETSKEKGGLKGAAASDEFMLVVIEKGVEFGDHMLSGAVVDPKGLDELIPDWRNTDIPMGAKVVKDDLFFLTSAGKYKLPFLPPAFENHGFNLVSLQQLTKWMGVKAEESGTMAFTSTAGVTPIFEDGKLTGVITDDKGVDKDGSKKSNFEAGMELRPKITILAEGPRGSLTKQIVSRLKLDEDRNSQGYVTGVKELWEVPKGRIKAGTIYHTLGFPLDYKSFGGGFIYAMSDEQIAIGLVTSLNYTDPRTDPHWNFQKLKTHPWISSLLKGGKMIKYGAKTITEGGYYAMPQLHHDNLMLVGESGGFLDPMRLKGIHLAFKSGVMAAQTAFNALSKEDYSSKELSSYTEQYQRSWVKKELWQSRNFHQGYENGLISGGMHTVAQLVTGGRGFSARLSSKPDHLHMRNFSDYPKGRTIIEKKFDDESL